MFTAAKAMDQGFEVVVLSGAGHEVRILPENGFNLYSWTVDGQQIMMEAEDLSLKGPKYGIPVLFPFPNRVKDSCYSWQGKAYTLQKRGVKVARHGLVCDEAFEVTDMGADENEAHCTAVIEIAPENALYEGYPFACRLAVTYTLTQTGVRMDAHVENLSEQLMPFGFAVHPYFTKRGDGNTCFIKVPAKRYYETDENLIPSGRILNAGEGTTIHDDFHSAESLDLDTVFRGLTEDMISQVRWSDLELAISASDCFRNAVVFTPKTRPGFCIEPQTCATNFINLHAQGFVDESGLLALAGGQHFACWVVYAVKKL